VVISADGKVMTAAHVVNAMDEITVEALGGERVSAKIIASEPAADLSLLQLERVPPSMRAARMADSSTVRVGDQVIVIGAPYGLAHSMSAGWVSARWPPNTVYKSMPLAEFFQTTATINTGNSGGPMFDMAAEVIGIVSHNISKSGSSEGLGFVVTINTAKKLMLERKSFWSGLDGIMLTGELAAIFNVPEPSAFLVKTVAQGSSAWDMGLLGGDKIATISGQQIAVGGDIILAVDGMAVGSDDNIEKIRNRLAAEPPGTPFKMRSSAPARSSN
jgi:S1-C subfamily serine protease